MEGRGGEGMLSNSELFPLLSPRSSGLTLVLLSLAVAILVPETPSIAPVSPHSYFGPTRSLVFNPPVSVVSTSSPHTLSSPHTHTHTHTRHTRLLPREQVANAKARSGGRNGIRAGRGGGGERPGGGHHYLGAGGGGRVDGADPHTKHESAAGVAGCATGRGTSAAPPERDRDRRNEHSGGCLTSTPAVHILFLFLAFGVFSVFGSSPGILADARVEPHAVSDPPPSIPPIGIRFRRFRGLRGVDGVD